MSAIELPSSPRILIVKLWALGDLLMATPLLTALKARYPGCHLTWLADRTHADILGGNPLIDELISLDTGDWRKSIRKGNVWKYLRRTAEITGDLKGRGFDLAINLTPEKKWTHLLAQAPRRIGMFPADKLDRSLNRYYTVALARPQESYRHSTAFYLHPMTVLGGIGPYDERMILKVSDEDREAARCFLGGCAAFDPTLPICVLHPGTSQESKCWPATSFGALGERLTSRYNIVITGSPKEVGLAESIASAVEGRGAIVAAGKLRNIRETAAIVERAAVVVTGDTSALHIASALGVPVVGIYGGTRPRDNRPQFGPNALLFDDTVPCAPCFKADCPLKGEEHMRCMKAITPAAVDEAISTLVKVKIG